MNLGRGIAGSAAGFATGNIPGAILGGLSGLFGSQPSENPILKQARLQQQGIANQLLGYANSPPGSSSDELANLANSRALLGADQRAAQQRVMAAWTPDQGTPAAALLANLSNSAIGQQSAARSSFLMDASAARRQALLQAAGIGAQAAGMYQPIPNQFPQMAAQLAQLFAYRQQAQQAQQQQGDVNTLYQQGASRLPGWYNPTPGAAPAPPPAGWATQGAPPAPNLNALLAALQQTGWGQQSPNGSAGSLTPGAPPPLTLPNEWQGVGMQGAAAPGNQIGGMNGLNNQIRQSMGLGRSLDLGGGLRLRF